LLAANTTGAAGVPKLTLDVDFDSGLALPESSADVGRTGCFAMLGDEGWMPEPRLGASVDVDMDRSVL
jgi:hypothetical protein